MSIENLTFESDQFKYKSRVVFGQFEVPKMTKFLMSKSIVKNEKQASYLLITISTIFLLLSIYVFWAYVISFPVEVTPEQLRQQQEFEEQMFRNGQNINQVQ